MKKKILNIIILVMIISGCSSGVREIIPQQIQDGDERASRGNTYLGNGYFDDAGISFMQAYKDYSLADDTGGCAASLTGLGISLFKQGREDEALLFLEKAEQYYLSLNRKKDIDEFYTTMTFLFIEKGDINKAEKYIARVGDLSAKRTLFAKALILVKQNKAYDALELIRQKGGDSSSLNNYVVGLAYFQMNKLDQAENYLFKALKQDQKDGASLKIAGDLESLYRVSLEKKDIQKAKDYLLRAVKIYSLIKNRKKLKELVLQLKNLNGGKNTAVDRYFMKLWLAD